MKQCPICLQNYDDTEYFCANDGSTLNVENSLSYIPFNDSEEIATQVISAPFKSQDVVQPKSDSAKWLYLIIGVLATSLLSIAIYLLMPKYKDQKNEIAGENRKNSESVNENNSQKSISTFLPNQNISATGSNTNLTKIAPAVNAGAKNNFTGNRSMNTINQVAKTAANSIVTNATPDGNWSGDWSSPSGAYLKQNIYLKDDGSGNLSGQIKWTLVSTNRPEKMNKIGLSATEYVSGKYDPGTQSVTLRGYRKDDPNDVLVMLDSYRLKLAGNRLSGFAGNGGKWNGRMNLTK